MLYELRVLTGLNSGALLPLNGTQWLIGSSPDADMVLYDEVIAQHHCRLQLDDSGWQVEALQGPLLTREGHRVEQIENLAPDTPFSLDGIWVCVAKANTPWQPEPFFARDPDKPPAADVPVAGKPRQRFSKRAAALCLIFAVAAFGVGGFMRDEPPAENRAEAVPKPQKTYLASAADVREILTPLIQQANLGQHISLETTNRDDIILHLAGDDKLQAATQALLQHFAARYQSAVQIAVDVVKPPPPLPFRIALVMKGDASHIVTDQGRRIFVNDEVGGIKLIGINENTLIFQGETRFEVPW